MVSKRMADLEPGEICVQRHGDKFVALGDGEFRWLSSLESQGHARNQDSVYEVIGKLPPDQPDATEWDERFRVFDYDPIPDDYKFDPWPAEEWFRDNAVAHLVRAGYNVLALCLHGDNSDYVRMNGMGWPDAGFVYGLHFDYDAIAFQWKDASGKQRLTVYRLTHGELPTMNELMGIDYEDD